jgi:hypothetical protein
MEDHPKFKFTKQSNGTIIIEVYSYPRNGYVLDHVLTIEEAESLAQQLLNAVRGDNNDD